MAAVVLLGGGLGALLALLGGLGAGRRKVTDVRSMERVCLPPPRMKCGGQCLLAFVYVVSIVAVVVVASVAALNFGAEPEGSEHRLLQRRPDKISLSESCSRLCARRGHIFMCFLLFFQLTYLCGRKPRIKRPGACVPHRRQSKKTRSKPHKRASETTPCVGTV